MSAFGKTAAGSIPTHGSQISAKDLFSDSGMLAKCRKMISGTSEGEVVASMASKVKISKYKVETFDLSDASQREAYEKLWMELFEMVSRGEAFVDARKDLVHRADGTSYWLKYMEYAIFSPTKQEGAESGEPRKTENMS